VAREDTARVEVQSALIDAAARLIATEGPSALTLRRVAEEVGTSTMAIYTHFGGMPELRGAVRREGFARLASGLADVEQSDDPVADLVMLGRAYYDNAVENAHLYRTMFMEQPLDAGDAALGWKETFESLVAGVDRCIAAGRFAPADPAALATELWALEHGIVSFQLAHTLSPQQALATLQSTGLRLFESYGDDRDSAERSFDRVRRAIGTAQPAGAPARRAPRRSR
jgi:AcrR family transcriptional regulator